VTKKSKLHLNAGKMFQLGEFVESALRHLLQLFKIHFRVLWHDLDPIKDCSIYGALDEDAIQQSNKRQQGTFNAHYLFPFSIATYVLLDSLYVLYNEPFSTIKQARLLSQLIAPQDYWSQGDIVIANAIWMEVCVYGMLLFDPKLPLEAQMYLHIDHKSNSVQLFSLSSAMSGNEVIALCTFRRKARQLVNVLMLSCIAQIEAFCVGNFVLKWTGSGRDLWMAAVVPLFFFYANFSESICGFFS